MTVERQRIDVWLWRARFFKARAAASRLVAEGGVRLFREGHGQRLSKASATVTAGDVLVFAEAGVLRAIKVEAFASRRGSAQAARGLYAEVRADLVA